jgi:serine/threonine protein kinase
MIGETINDEYLVEELIGKGGFGEVFVCKDLQLDRYVALKILHGATKQNKELKRFLSEGKILASLNHPNVVHINRLGYHNDSPFIVMEYIDGKPFREHLEGPPIPLTKGLEYMHQIASGLGAIHAKGIVHRDLSSNNIMITRDGTAKILDLGLARDPRVLSTASMQGGLVGTIAYVSPEQVEGKPATFASDIFAFGILLYELVTRKHPFIAEHHMSMLYNIANKEARPIEETVESPPPGLSRLIGDCLNKDPEERPTDLSRIEQIIQELTKTSVGTSTRLIPIEVQLASRRPTPTNPYLNRTMLRRRTDFFGRKQEVRRIYARLNANPPGSVSIVGDRKIGKSSLLNFVYMNTNREQNLEHPEKMVMVFIDLQEEKNMTIQSFVGILLRMAQLELRGRLEVSNCAYDLDGVKDMVHRLNDHGFRMAILLDEFEAITTNPNFPLEFFSFLRYLANHYNVAYLTSSARDLQALCYTKEISDSPFFNIFSNMLLTVFKPNEAEELIRIPSEEAGKPLAPYTAQILDLAGLFPFFLQMVCAHVLDYMEENPERSEPDFDEVGRRFYQEAKLHYRYIWINMDDHERSAVRRVAQGKNIPDALRHVIQELESRNLVEFSNGQPKLFASTFSTFLREEAEKDKPSLLKKLFGRK